MRDPPRDRAIAYSEIAGLPRSTVKGHVGRFVLDEIGGTRVVFAQGRVHLYEGHSAREITAGVRFLARAGVEKLILTNAAGTVNPDFSPGSWMMITDHLNFTGTTPLLGGTEFVDLTDAYSPAWRERFRGRGAKRKIDVARGVYAGCARSAVRDAGGSEDAAPARRRRDRDVHRARNHPGARARAGSGRFFLPNELGGGIE